MMRTHEKRVRRSLVRQLDTSDCGPACLATIIRFFGGLEPVERIRELTGTGPDGTTLLGLLRAAPALGLLIEGFEARVEDLENCDDPCILHVVSRERAYHFVVYFGQAAGRFLIADPAVGLKRLARSDLERIWISNALLTVRRSSAFITRQARAAEKRRWLIDAIKDDARSLTLAALLGVLISTFGLAVALFSQALLDDILPNRNSLKLGVGLGLVAFFLLAQNALTAVRQFILIRQARDFNNRIIRHFIDSLVRLPFPFFASRKTGDLVSRLNDTGRLQRFVTFALGAVTINLLMLATALTFVLLYSLTIGLWVVGGLVLLGGSAAASHRRIVSGQVGVMSARAVNESRYVDTIRGMEAIKSVNAEHVFAARMKQTFATLQEAAFRLGRVGVSFSFAAQFSGLFVILGTTGWGAAFVLDGTLQIGAFVALIQMTNMLIPSAYGLALSNIELQEASVAFDRIYQFTGLEPEDAGPTGHIRASSAVPWFEHISVEKVSFRFPGRAPLFSDVSFSLRRGEFVLLVGSTGSGKSTLLRILIRLYHAESGIINVNGRDWSSIPTHIWRSVAAIVPQHVQVFSGTLAENICMRPVRATNGVAKFCKGLGLDGMFGRLPHGYVTLLGEGGVRLSGGQLRLLGLSRALYRRPQLLLVDELIAGLDRQAARQALDIILRKKNDMGMLVVSHRNDFTAMADRVYALDAATLREVGIR